MGGIWEDTSMKKYEIVTQHTHKGPLGEYTPSDGRTIYWTMEQVVRELDRARVGTYGSNAGRRRYQRIRDAM